MMRCTVMPATLIAVLSMSSPVAGAEPAIIPSPVEMRVGEGEFGLSDRTVVVAQGGAAAEAQKLIDAQAVSRGASHIARTFPSCPLEALEAPHAPHVPPFPWAQSGPQVPRVWGETLSVRLRQAAPRVSVFKAPHS